MIKIAVCDDDLATTVTMERLLRMYDSELFDIHVFTSSKKLKKSFDNDEYDLLLLDIQMPDFSGIELAKFLRETNQQTLIIFLTSFEKYMPEVFSIRTFDYLLKPITKEKLFPVLNRLINYTEADEGRFIFTFNKNLHSLKFREIIYFEKNKKWVYIHTRNKIHKAIMSNAELLNKLNNNFLQCHNSYILNTKYVCKLSSKLITLSDGESVIELPIGRKFSDNIRKELLLKLKEVL